MGEEGSGLALLGVAAAGAVALVPAWRRSVDGALERGLERAAATGQAGGPGSLAAALLSGWRLIPRFEPLDYVSHLVAYHLGNGLFGWTAVDAYVWLSCLVAPVYLAGLWRLSRQRRWRSPPPPCI